MAKAAASPALDGKFEVVGVVPGEIVFGHLGKVDLRSISLAHAEQLHAEGCPYLKRVEKKASKSDNSIA